MTSPTQAAPLPRVSEDGDIVERLNGWLGGKLSGGNLVAFIEATASAGDLIEEAAAEITRLQVEVELFGKIVTGNEWHKEIHAIRSRAEAAEAALAETVKVLEPFAKEADRYDPDMGDSSDRLWASSEGNLRLMHLRAARSFLLAHGSKSNG